MADFSQELIAGARAFDREAAPARMRVHAFAKELGVASKEALALLEQAGVTGKKAASTVTAEDRAKALDAVLAADQSAQPQAPAEEKTEENPGPKDDKPAKKKARKPAKKAAMKTAEKDEPKKADEPEPKADEPAAESDDSQPSVKRVRRRRVRRATASSDNAEASRAAEAAQERAEDQATAAREELRAQSTEEGLSDVEPPLTPPPGEAPVFQAPVFMAPEPTPVPAGDAPAVDRAEADTADTADDAQDDGDGRPRQIDREPRRRRRGRRRRAARPRVDGGDVVKHDDGDDDVPQIEEPAAVKGSTRLEAQRRRRNERREASRKRHVISEAEFLARRESVERTMVVRERDRHDGRGRVTQVGVLEDELLVEHFVTSETQASQIGNIYLGRVQNVLASMEAAFIDIGTDRNAVIYASDLVWSKLGSGAKSRRIEQALKAGDQVLVQVTKDPVGHKGARLSMQISLAGRFLVYVPGGRSAGISRKLPEPERKRLKEILKDVTPEGSGTIIRTAAEGVGRDEIAADVARLEKLWRDIEKRAEDEKAKRGAKPVTMYSEPEMLVKVVRDLFNEDFSTLIVDGDASWRTVRDYVTEVAPDLADRLERYDASAHDGADAFATHRIDEQITKALDRKVWLPSGGTLVIDRTEAMTVIDVNTGKFTGVGGNLEETVTRNNLEAAEEIVRQLRLRDIGGMVVIDFIDMILPENQDLVLRRLKEALGRDRTRHEVSEVTSLGLVQMTRKRLGTGLLETFSTPCPHCDGRGLIIHTDPVEQEPQQKPRSKRSKRAHDPSQHPTALAMHKDDAENPADPDGRPAAKDDAKDPDSGQQPRRRSRRRSGRGREEGQDREPQQENPRDKAPEAEERDDAQADTPDAPTRDDEDAPRGRRRGRRRAGRRTAHRAADLPQRDEDATGHDEDDGDRIAAIAAAAVAEATAKDPDEPSDDRYRPADDADAGDSEPAGDKPAPRSASARRRHRRRVVRRARREEAQEAPQREEPKREEPKPRGRKAYEEALAAFEASPRRKRPTRGKSASDVPPNPADFGLDPDNVRVYEDPEPEVPQQPKEAAAPKEEQARQEPAAEPRAKDDAAEESPHRRGRRRAVRRTAARRPASGQTDKPATQARKAEPKQEPKAGRKQDTPAESSGNRRGRRRAGRRAVRRTAQ